MSAADVPPWLADFQRAFGAVVRASLDRSTGTLRTSPSEYTLFKDSLAGASARGLGAYNLQYWCRLFIVLQGQFPLVAALTGAWAFNGLAAQFLREHPPRGHDLGAVGDAFAAFLEARAPEEGLVPDGLNGRLPRRALVQAAFVDDAFRRVLAAPEEAPFRPSPEDAARLLSCRLIPARALSIVDEDWPLFEVRHALPHPASSRAEPLPPPHPSGPRSWAVLRSGPGHRVWPLLPSQAKLLRSVAVRPIGEAVAALEAEGDAGDPALLARQVRRWLAESVDNGLWTGLAEVRREP
jgi:hypothetical protein